jgi:hypothetical protein
MGANIIYSTLIFKKTAESTVSEFSEETAKNQRALKQNRRNKSPTPFFELV